MTYLTNKISNSQYPIPNMRQAGVTLLLAILVLSSIMAISFSLATILLIEIRSSSDLVKTEPALYGSNAVAEEAIFNVKRKTCQSDPSYCNYTLQFSNNVSLPTPPIQTSTTTPIYQDKVVAAGSFATANRYDFFNATAGGGSTAGSGYGKVALTYLDSGVPNPPPLIVFLCQFNPSLTVDPTGQTSNSYHSTACSDETDTLSAGNISYWPFGSAKGTAIYPNTPLSQTTWSLDVSQQQELIVYNPDMQGRNVYIKIETYGPESYLGANDNQPTGLPYAGKTAIVINAVNGSVGRKLRVVIPNLTNNAAATSSAQNVAAASNGGIASASSQLSSSYSIANINDGDRLGNNWAGGSTGGGWNDSSGPPSWAEVDFSGTKTISEIDVYTLANCFGSCTSIDATTPADNYGISDFQVQYDNGGSWQTIPGGSVSGNALAWQQFTFSAVTTGKIRVLITAARTGFSRLVELEAWGTGASASIGVSLSPKTTSLSQSQQQAFNVTVTGTGNNAVNWSLTPNIGTMSGNTYIAPSTIGSIITVTAKATSQADGTTSDTATITLNPPNNTATLIHAGGGAYTDSLSRNWSADMDFSGGSTYTTGNTISNTTDPTLYQSERWGNMSYTITGLTPNSSHTVKLKFAEIYWTSPGQRVFNVSINGSQVLSNFDIVQDAGANLKADDKSFSATADGSGNITIQFIGIVDNAKISSIEVD